MRVIQLPQKPKWNFQGVNEDNLQEIEVERLIVKLWLN